MNKYDEVELTSSSSSSSASPPPAVIALADECDSSMMWTADFSHLPMPELSNPPQHSILTQQQQQHQPQPQGREPPPPPPPPPPAAPAPPQAVPHHIQPPPLTALDRELLWYSKKELAVHRKDVRRTILFLRNCGGAELFTDSTDGKVDALGGAGDREICFRGCERYYSLETRFMIQKTLVDAVLEAQESMEDEFELRQLSESLSESCKELAAWHAKLNAFQCWGLRGMRSVSVPASTSTSNNNSSCATSSSNHHRRHASQTTATTTSVGPLSWEQQSPKRIPPPPPSKNIAASRRRAAAAAAAAAGSSSSSTSSDLSIEFFPPLSSHNNKTAAKSGSSAPPPPVPSIIIPM